MMSPEKLPALVAHCTDPHGCSFYRNLYAMPPGSPSLTLPSMDAWRKLPFVTKETILAVPLWSRLFADGFGVEYLRVSSGTSGKPPVFSGRTNLRDQEYRMQYHDFKKGILAFGVPAMPHWHEALQRSLGYTPRVVVFDPKNPKASVRLARIAGVDSITTFAFHMPLMAEHMRQEGMNENIRFIEICGEPCTKLLFEYLREVFPNAVILPNYGAGEVEDNPMGVPCHEITGEEPLSVFHPKETQYYELVDPETDSVLEPRAGTEGELVVSAYPGEPSAFPLIRYKSGDMIRIVESPCPKHGSWSFEVIGRVSSDFLKISGGMLRADEGQRVVRLFSALITDRFEMHRFEEQTPKGPKTRVEFRVEPIGTVDLELLAGKIASALRINPALTYADGVAQDRYFPLSCTVLELQPGKKIKRLVAH